MFCLLVETLGLYNARMLAAVTQMRSTMDRAANLRQAEELLCKSAEIGARLAMLPEHFAFMQPEGLPPRDPEPLRGPLVKWLSGLARELDLWIVGGSFAHQPKGQKRVYNTCPLINPKGELTAWYSKIHLFDLAIPGSRKLTESAHVKPGRRLVVAQTPLGAMGLSICFDLRFPELYRRLRLRGAEILAAPSAFTKLTGQAHWEILIRARAVENCCFVMAAAQEGAHTPKRESYGRAMIVDPWGVILAECPPGPGLAVAEISSKEVERHRRRLDTTRLAKLFPAAWRKEESK
jgi:predicted amidohydrolase